MRITKRNLLLNDDHTVTIIKEYSKNYQTNLELNCAENIMQLMNNVFKLNKQPEEYMYLITLTTKNKSIGFFEISHGTHNATTAGIREIFIRALLSNAASIILVHNHPSGDPTPSDQDLQFTEKVKQASKLMEIPLLDHIILGKETYYSFHEHWHLSQKSKINEKSK